MYHGQEITPPPLSHPLLSLLVYSVTHTLGALSSNDTQ